VQRTDIDEIRERTYKARDAWWTVLLVDPIAVHLVRFVAPYRWITPNLLSALAFVFGLASAACFAMQDRWWLVAGALLFHVSFVIDCMDGKVARLNGTGTMFGVWFDFIFDRLRVVLCTVALMGGQYARTGDVAWVWLAAGVLGLDLFRYLNGAQMAKIKAAMRLRLDEARGVTSQTEVVDDEGETEEPVKAGPARSPYERVRNALLRRRIRIHLFSGIEFEMTVFVVGPLIGYVFWTSIAAGVLLLLFEALLVFRLWQLIGRWKSDVAAAERKRAAEAPEGREPGMESPGQPGEQVSPAPTPTRV
jgi:phosphatidylglycerophosphate synthase